MCVLMPASVSCHANVWPVSPCMPLIGDQSCYCDTLCVMGGGGGALACIHCERGEGGFYDAYFFLRGEHY